MLNEISKMGQPQDAISIGLSVRSEMETLRRNFETSKKLAEALNPDRKLNVAYYFGNQWCYYDLEDGILRNTKLGEDVQLIVDNVLSNALDLRVAATCNETPQMEAVAMSEDGADFASANLVNRILKAIWYDRSFTDVFQRAHKIAGLRYNCYARLYWDKTRGDFGDDGVPQGDWQLELVAPECVFVDPLARRVMPSCKEPGDARWLFHLSNVDVSDVVLTKEWADARVETTTAGGRAIYGGCPELDDIKTTDSTLPTDDMVAMHAELGLDAREAAKGASIFDGKDGKGKSGGEHTSRRVKLLFYYEHPSLSYPRGRYAVIMPDNDWHVLEYRDELPFATAKHKQGLFLWFMLNDVRCAESLEGRCRFSDARADQDAINKRKTEWMNSAEKLRPLVVADKDAGVKGEDIRRQGMLDVLEVESSVNGNGQPIQVHYPTARVTEGQVAMDEIVFLTSRAESKMGYHTVANYPKRDSTTLGELEKVQLDDIMRLKSTDAKVAEQTFYAPIMAGVLRLMQRFYDTKRMVAFFGDEGEATVEQFCGEDIKFSDVLIRPGSSVEMSRAVRIALTLQAAQLGMYQSQNDPDEARRLRADFADELNLRISHEASIAQLSRRGARDNIKRLMQGKESNIDSWNDHAEYIGEYARFFNEAAYRLMPDAQRESLRAKLNKEIEMRHVLMTEGLPTPGAAQLSAQLTADQPGSAAGGLIGGAVPTDDGRMLVPQPRPGGPATSNQMLAPDGGETEIPAEAGMGGGETPAV